MRTKLYCFLAVFFIVTLTNAQPAEVRLLGNINPGNPASGFWRGNTSSAYPVTLTVQGALMVYDYYHSDSTRKKIIPHVAAKLLVLVATEGLKLAINRQRPYIKYPALIHPFNASETGLSFPSAHTSLAFNTAATLSIRFKKWYVTLPAYLWAGCVGYSRLYLGEHYPTDVLAGAIVGAGSAYLVDWMDRKLFNIKHTHENAATKVIY